MKNAVILPVLICSLFLWPLYIQASPIGDMPGAEKDSGGGLGLEGPGITIDDSFRIVDQLGSVGINDSSFFDFFGEDEGVPGSKRSAYHMEMFTEGIGGVRTSILGFDRRTGFDRGTRLDERLGLDKGATFDKGAKVDKGAGFDSVGGFDSERVFQIGQESEGPSFLFRREKSFQNTRVKGDNFLTRDQTGGGSADEFTKQGTGGDALSGEKERLEQDLLRSEEMDLRSVRPVKSSYFIKIAMFAGALLLLLAGTLKGLIPLRFYFFLTILIIILWNPMESLFISIIIGLSALLAPVLS